MFLLVTHRLNLAQNGQRSVYSRLGIPHVEDSQSLLFEQQRRRQREDDQSHAGRCHQNTDSQLQPCTFHFHTPLIGHVYIPSLQLHRHLFPGRIRSPPVHARSQLLARQSGLEEPKAGHDS